MVNLKKICECDICGIRIRSGEKRMVNDKGDQMCDICFNEFKEEI